MECRRYGYLITIGLLTVTSFGCGGGGETTDTTGNEGTIPETVRLITEANSVLRTHRGGDELNYVGTLMFDSGASAAVSATRRITEVVQTDPFSHAPAELLQAVDELTIHADIDGVASPTYRSASLFDQTNTGSIVVYAASVEQEPWHWYYLSGTTDPDAPQHPVMLSSPLSVGDPHSFVIQEYAFGDTGQLSSSTEVAYSYWITGVEQVETSLGVFEAYRVETTRAVAGAMQTTWTWYYPPLGKVKVEQDVDWGDGNRGRLVYRLASTNIPFE